MKKQHSALGKATSSILAFVLAVGLVPSGAMAYAAEAAAQAPAAQTDEAAGSQASTASEASQPETNADTAQTGTSEDATGNSADAAASSESTSTAAEAADVRSADSSSDDSTASAPAATATYTNTANGVVQAQVPLSTGDQVTTVGSMQVGGLTYTINTADPTTVSVTGVAADKPEGEVAVQSQIANGGITYKVTNISSPLNLGGGGSPILSKTAKTPQAAKTR